MDRFASIAEMKGMKIFARVDHVAGAAPIEKTIRPAEVLVFSNPKGETLLIECTQTVGIDLPMKSLVWRNSSDQVWLAYDAPSYLAQRHGASKCPAVDTLDKPLAGLAAEVVPQ